MKKILVVLFLWTAVLSLSASGSEGLLSEDPRLKGAMEALEKGREYMERGHREFRRRPGLAQEMFEHAEDYFTKAAYLYGRIGEKHDIRVVNEIEECRMLGRRAHVMTGKARKEKRKKKTAF
ncbi:MAG: hypothetical protein GF408_00425 [Candidatus Omnitrophica bacterium]|nr:hypothetical protein [Candidatus Omnitrophota bacterium]